MLCRVDRAITPSLLIVATWALSGAALFACESPEQVEVARGETRDAAADAETPVSDNDASSPVEPEPAVPEADPANGGEPNGDDPANGGGPSMPNDGNAGEGAITPEPDVPFPDGTVTVPEPGPDEPQLVPGEPTPDSSDVDGGPPECNPNDSLECPCPEGQLRCYGVCTDPLTNPNHCGATDGCELTETPGTQCQPVNSVCEGGQCVPCEMPLVACGNACLDPTSDGDYCGAAPGCSPDEGTRGDRCTNPEQCLESVCVECVVFEARTTAIPEHGEQLALGDVNGDDLPDVVTLTGEGGELVVIDSGSGFEIGEQTAQAFGDNPTALGLGLVNEDDVLDVVVGDATTGIVSVGLGNGDGTFTAGATYEVEGTPRELVLAHVDGDPTLDAFVVTNDSSGPTLLLGAGDGTFAPAPPITWPERLYASSTGDLNEDGALDIVLVGLQEQALVLLGDGTGAFQASTHEIEGTSYAVKLAELNGDDHVDMVTGHSAGYNVNISIGNGDGTFQAAIRANVSESLESYDAIVNAVDVADFDGDSKLDIVVAMNSGVSVMWGRENWAVYGHGVITEYSEFLTMITGDYNDDGITDVISNLYNTNSDFRVDFGVVPPECAGAAP